MTREMTIGMMSDLLTKAESVPGWYPSEGLKELLWLVEPYSGKVGLEVGTWYGRSATILAGCLAKLTCVDTWVGLPQAPDDPRYKYKGDVLEAARKNLAGYNVEFVTGNSNQVLFTFPHQSFDVIHIDGDHSNPTVTNDVLQAWRLLRKGGLLCGDDYDEPDVREAVHRLRLRLLSVVNGRLWYTYRV